MWIDKSTGLEFRREEGHQYTQLVEIHSRQMYWEFILENFSGKLPIDGTFRENVYLTLSRLEP